MGCHFLVTTLVSKHAHILVNLYLIVKNWFISVFINVLLYRLALSAKAIGVRYPLILFIITSSKLMP